MNIDPTSSFTPVSMPQSAAPAKGGNEAKVTQPDVGLEKTPEAFKQQELVQKLAAMDDVRPEVVEAGKQLANDPNFPSDNEMDQLARALLSPVAEG